MLRTDVTRHFVHEWTRGFTDEAIELRFQRRAKLQNCKMSLRIYPPVYLRERYSFAPRLMFCQAGDAQGAGFATVILPVRAVCKHQLEKINTYTAGRIKSKGRILNRPDGFSFPFRP